MLALVVVLGNMGWNPRFRGSEQDASEGEARYVFKNISVFNSVRDRFAPGEWGVSGNKHTWDSKGV
jgi:hypothetical protein